MRVERAALELGMELHADEPWMVRPLDDLGQLVVGRHPRKNQSTLLQRVAIMDVHLIAVPVALADHIGAVERADDAVAVKLSRIGAKAHRPAKIAAGGALL